MDNHTPELTDKELNDLVRRYVYEQDETVAATLLNEIQTEYALRGVSIYKPEE